MSVVMVTGKFHSSWEKGQIASASGLENRNGSYAYSLTRWDTDLPVLDIALLLLLLMSSHHLHYLHLESCFKFISFFPFEHRLTYVLLFVRLIWWGHLLFSLMRLMAWLQFAQVDKTRYTGMALVFVTHLYLYHGPHYKFDAGRFHSASMCILFFQNIMYNSCCRH